MTTVHETASIIARLSIRHTAHSLELAIAWHFAESLVSAYAQRHGVDLDRVLATLHRCIVARCDALQISESQVRSALTDVRAAAVKVEVFNDQR